jgi:uncharacterized caspase-like protein
LACHFVAAHAQIRGKFVVRLSFCLAGILCLLALGGNAPASAADRVALVIGNGAYQKVPALPNPPRDAADVGAALERLNFKVTRLNNASAAEMRKALVDFGRATEGSEMAVVFYAGHGMEAGGENWLIPTDAELRNDSDVESEAVSLRSINLQVSKARQLGLVILDACRNNPFAAKMQRSLRSRAVARGLAPTEPTDNVLVAYAARDGTTANDGDGRNSPFTTALLRNIETPGLEISFLFRNVRDEVMTATKREQQPFVYGSLSKEAIYLKPPPVAQPPAPAVPAAASATPPVVIAKTSPEQSAGKDRATPVDEKKRNTFTDEDAKRISAFGAALDLKMPSFAIGETKSDVPESYAQFVGVWSSRTGFGEGKGRKGMLIVTEVLSDGLALGYYLWGPPTKLSWEKAPASYMTIADKIIGGVLRFDSGSIVAKFGNPNELTLKSINRKKAAEIATVKFEPLWQLIPRDQPKPAKRLGGRSSEDSRPAKTRDSQTISTSREEKADSPRAGDPESTKTLYAKCSAEGHRIAGGKHKNVGFSRIEACVRNGGQM